MKKNLFVFLLTLSFFNFKSFAEDSSVNQIPAISITDSLVALPNPVGTYKTPVSSLRYEPRVDLQSRHLPEAQADVSIRGGIFENTGMRVGSATLYDPQTGHYTAEIPISPFMLSTPEIFTGMTNSLYGFNSTVGTVNYGWTPISTNIIARAGGGSHDLNHQHAYFAKQGLFSSDVGSLNMDFDVARSELSGTRPDGSHDFERLSGRLQWLTSSSQTDLFFGYQDKFFEWPNLYVLQELHDLVGGSNVESEDIQTSLVMLNHRQQLEDNDYFEITGYYRRNKDNYEFDVTQPGLFNDFKHETDVYSIGLSGQNDLEIFNLKYAGQYVAEEIDSTALTFGDFDTRSLGKFSVLPEKVFEVSSTDQIVVGTGISYEDSDRDSETFTPSAGIAWHFMNDFSDKQKLYFEYAKSSQLPGQTAIASNSEAGLFRGNQDLKRERSHNLEVGYQVQKDNVTAHLATFYRQDEDLVDWTFSSDTLPNFSRSANNVDIDVFGIESIVTATWDYLDLIFGYTFMHKNEDYAIADVDASFYALNFPEHRVTTALIIRPLESLELRFDNEFRAQEDNVLRNGEDEAFFTSAELYWNIPETENLAISLAIDNIWKTSFEDVPGVPGQGRLFSASLEYKLQ